MFIEMMSPKNYGEVCLLKPVTTNVNNMYEFIAADFLPENLPLLNNGRFLFAIFVVRTNETIH